MDEPVARRMHPGTQRMELGLLPATDGAVLEGGAPGQDWSRKKAREWGRKYSFPVLESGEAPQGKGV